MYIANGVACGSRFASGGRALGIQVHDGGDATKSDPRDYTRTLGVIEALVQNQSRSI